LKGWAKYDRLKKLLTKWDTKLKPYFIINAKVKAGDGKGKQ